MRLRVPFDRSLASLAHWNRWEPAVYSRPPRGDERFALGVYRQLVASADDDWADLKARFAEEDVPPGLPWFGAVPFDLGAYPLGVWAVWPKAIWFVPRLYLTKPRGANTAEVLYIPPRGADVMDVRADVADLLDVHGEDAPGAAPSFGEPEDFHRFADKVERALREIRQGRLEKLVVARFATGRVTRPLDEVLEALAQRYQDSHVFALSWQGRWLLSASPERLCAVRNGRVEIDCLAGTAPRGRDDEEDRLLADELLASAKNRKEHQAVVDHVVRTVAPLCERMDVQGGPLVLKLANVQHLLTRVGGQLKSGVGLLDVAEVLHPTPAVAGTPQREATSYVTAHEGWPRGYYTGAFGTYAGGEGELDVCLRSAFVDAGGGRPFCRLRHRGGLRSGVRVGGERAQAEADARGAGRRGGGGRAVNPDLWPVHALVDGLYASGVRRAVISPGSRNTPLVFALIEHGGIQSFSHMDERSAGFFALGMARERNEPVAIVCTSGTAVANLYPAVVEAYFSRVPLVVLTADRPAELREVGANQTIRQPNLFGSHVKWACETPAPEDRVEMALDMRGLALRAGLVARSAPEGPVHVNVPFREPLLPPRRAEAVILAELAAIEAQPAPAAPCSPSALAWVENALRRARRPAVVAGPMRPGPLAQAVADFAARSGIPLFADILSNCRASEASVLHYDLALRAPAGPEPPDLVLRFGAEPTSKALSEWLRKSRAEFFVFDETPIYRDSGHAATHVVIGDPTVWLREASIALDVWSAYRTAWRRASDAVSSVLAQPEALPWFEGEAVRKAVEALGPSHLLVLGNSRPVRDADALARPEAGVEIYANRGASGIDGVTSTALGHAVASRRPTLLVIGDVSFYHDLNGLLMAREVSSPFVVLLVHNGGGGIFRHLSQASRPGEIDWFTTPHHLDFAPIVRAYGGAYASVGDRDALVGAVREGMERPGLTVVETRFPNDESPRVYRDLAADCGERWRWRPGEAYGLHPRRPLRVSGDPRGRTMPFLARFYRRRGCVCACRRAAGSSWMPTHRNPAGSVGARRQRGAGLRGAAFHGRDRV